LLSRIFSTLTTFGNSSARQLEKQQPRSFMLYLPLYNGVRKLEIGIAADAEFEPIRPGSVLG